MNRKTVAIFSIGLILSSPTFLAALTIALKPDKNPDSLLVEREKFQEFLSHRINVPCSVVVPMSASVIQTGLETGTIDVAYVSSTDLLILEKYHSAKFLASVLAEGKDTYESIWLVRADDPAKTVADLRGARIAFAGRTSTSGYVLPMNDLYKRGFLKPGEEAEQFFGKGNVIFSSGYVGAVELLLSGDVRAAAVSDYVYYKDKHLNTQQKNQLRVLSTAGLVPVHVIVASQKAPEKILRKFLEALLELNTPERVSLRDEIFGGEISITRNEKAHLELKQALTVLKILE